MFERTIDLHLAACRKAKPDPEALAAKLLQWELSDGGMFDDAVDRYKGVLGKKGMAAYRRLAEERWNAASSAKGAEKNYTLTSIMERLATKAGDLEALVAVRMRDLSQPWSYAQIARDYLKAGKHEEALEWGEKGLAAFPQQWNDGGLRELVADEYHRLQRHDDAMKLIWASFARTPGLSSYEPLRTHARRAGDWPAWRTKALDTIRRSISSTTKVRDPWHSPRGRSELVRIFLWENDVDAAWREAEEGGCSNDLWLQLAAKREKSHPADALRVYLEQVESAVKSSTGDYGESIRLLEKARSIADRLDRTAGFRALIARLRTEHRRRRNLQKRLDQKKW